jgi:hypothetical protein
VRVVKTVTGQSRKEVKEKGFKFVPVYVCIGNC